MGYYLHRNSLLYKEGGLIALLFLFSLDVPQLKKIDKTKKLCYYIYVIERETERPLCSRLPEETAEKKMNLLVAQEEEQPQNAGMVVGSNPIQYSEVWVSISWPTD